MDEAETFATWDLLRDFGFQPDQEVKYSDFEPGLSFDFGNFKLSAGCFTNLRFTEVVSFSGVLKTRRTIAEVSFEMPRRIKSRELCAAWIVWNLDLSAGTLFVPAREVAWVIDGRKSKDLLPWRIDRAERESEQKAYRARPTPALKLT